MKVRSLLQPVFGKIESDAEISTALRKLTDGRDSLPDGCSITDELQSIVIIKSMLRIRAEDDATTAFYTDFRQQHGTRPTAVDIYHACRNPNSLRRSHGSWLGFFHSMGDLTPAEQACVETAGEFLERRLRRSEKHDRGPRPSSWYRSRTATRFVGYGDLSKSK